MNDILAGLAAFCVMLFMWLIAATLSAAPVAIAIGLVYWLFFT